MENHAEVPRLTDSKSQDSSEDYDTQEEDGTSNRRSTGPGVGERTIEANRRKPEHTEWQKRHLGEERATPRSHDKEVTRRETGDRESDEDKDVVGKENQAKNTGKPISENEEE